MTVAFRDNSYHTIYKDMKKGFTLIEIMVVIAIMGVLITMIAGSFIASQKKGRDLKRKSDIVQVGKAMEMYFYDKGRYPLGDAGTGKFIGCVESVGGPEVACDWGSTTGWKNATAGVIYMGLLPKDPTSTQKYWYSSDATGSYYKIYARLENTSDASIGSYTTICSGAATVCNYGTSSPNTSP
jgi:type II secretion system protein G